MEQETSLLNASVLRKQGKFSINVYRKPTFSGVYTQFDSFLPGTYQIGSIYTLVNRCFRICSNWSIFYSQLIL